MGNSMIPEQDLQKTFCYTREVEQLAPEKLLGPKKEKDVFQLPTIIIFQGLC